MQHLHILAVGALSESWLREGCAHYQKRIARYFKLTVTELDEYRLPGSPSPAQIEQALEREAQALRGKLPARSISVALCPRGKALDTPGLAGLLERGGNGVAFIIGSSHGMSETLRESADLRVSLSPLTFPHQLARLVLLEQIYRCGNIQGGGKYHK